MHIENTRATSPTNTTALRLRTQKVLVVDDDEQIRAVLHRVLSQRGYDVVLAEDGAAALALLIEHPEIDMAFLDITMPRVDGLQTLRGLRGLLGPTVPVVMVTGKSEDRDVLRGYGEGADYYVTKPFSPTTIRNIVDYLQLDPDGDEAREMELIL